MTATRRATPVRGRKSRPATALLILAFGAVLLSVIHGAAPHHTLPGPCHDCEALSSPAEFSPVTVAIDPIEPERPAAPRAETPVVEPPDRWLGPSRAPPADSAA